MQTLIVGKSSMSVLISQLTYIPETHTGVFLPGHLRFDLPRTEVEVVGKMLLQFLHFSMWLPFETPSDPR